MMKTVVLAVAAAMLAASCYVFDTTSHAWLEVGVGAGYADGTFEMEWPPESGEHIAVNQSLTDSAGFAGIEVEINVPGESPRILTATDFYGRRNNTVDLIKVPEEGRASIFVKLYQQGEMVARGHISWPLDSVAGRWRLVVERIPWAWGVGIRKNGDPVCLFPWCYNIERIEIDEAARNHPDEALWLVLDRHTAAG